MDAAEVLHLVPARVHSAQHIPPFFALPQLCQSAPRVSLPYHISTWQFSSAEDTMGRMAGSTDYILATLNRHQDERPSG
jgi:hypothetical protein